MKLVMMKGKAFMEYDDTKYKKLVELIVGDELKYGDCIIIGDNSSGKSWLLSEIVKKTIKKRSKGIYFIDAVNRGFAPFYIINGHVKKKPDLSSEEVVRFRLKEEYFNVQDSFSPTKTGTEKVEEFYPWYEQRVQELFKGLTNESFSIVDDFGLGEVVFDNNVVGLLSSGYQALVRIFLELLYFEESNSATEVKKPIVVIDEIDEFLSPRISSRIWHFLKEKFPEFRLVVSTHSADVVIGAEKANIITLDGNEFETLDAGDYSTTSEISIVFDRVFGDKRNIRGNGLNKVLRRLLNNKINNAWTDTDQNNYNNIIGRGDLSTSQKLILKQIEEWKR